MHYLIEDHLLHNCAIRNDCNVACLLHVLLVIDAVRRNPLTCRATDSVIQQAIIRWLQFACDRDGGRQRRNTSRSHALYDQCSRSSQRSRSPHRAPAPPRSNRPQRSRSPRRALGPQRSKNSRLVPASQRSNSCNLAMAAQRSTPHCALSSEKSATPRRALSSERSATPRRALSSERSATAGHSLSLERSCSPDGDSATLYSSDLSDSCCSLPNYEMSP